MVKELLVINLMERSLTLDPGIRYKFLEEEKPEFQKKEQVLDLIAGSLILKGA